MTDVDICWQVCLVERLCQLVCKSTVVHISGIEARYAKTRKKASVYAYDALRINTGKTWSLNPKPWTAGRTRSRQPKYVQKYSIRSVTERPRHSKTTSAHNSPLCPNIMYDLCSCWPTGQSWAGLKVNGMSPISILHDWVQLRTYLALC